MPGQPGTERRLLSGQVLVRLPVGTAAAVRSAAAAAGLTDAAWVRGQLVAALGTDPADAVPVAALPPRRLAPTADVIEIARLREAVGEAHGTLRQIAGLDRARGGTRLAEIDGGIDALLAAIVDLDAAKGSLLRRRRRR